jgi:alpha-ketoglutarate-dependent taurine dioxygenase
MSTESTESTETGGIRGMRRRQVATTRLIETEFLPGHEERTPLIVRPAVENVDLAEWCAANREELNGFLDKYGAVVFKGFGMRTAADFERTAAGISPELFAEYGDLPQESTTERIYHSTPYPEDKMILFHNESSHLPQWPLRQFFFCVIPAADRGETPLLDCRRVYDALDPELRQEFSEKGLMYVRNFSEGIDVPWQEFFHTTDQAEVERVCSEAGMGCEWTSNGGLRISQVSPAVAVHPRTGEKAFFNQIQLHHVSCLDEETRSALRQLFAEEDMPRNVYFGDGTPIPDEVVAGIGELYEELCVEPPWAAGDMIVLDNMIVAHARRPFSGERKILVAMAEMVDAKQLAPLA